MQLTSIKNHILFEFVNQVVNRAFANETNWGFTVLDKKEDVKLGRWAKVLHRGPEVANEIQEGNFIFIEPLAWTTKVSINKKDYWMTDDSKVLLVSEELPRSL